MQKKPTLLVLSALILIFGYFTWEHFSLKNQSHKEKEEMTML
jgi:hypothetical protein